MNKLKQKIVEFFNSLNSKQKLLVAIIVLIVATVFYSLFINNSYKSNEINYKNLDAQSIIETSEITYDRAVITALDGIITNIIKVNFDGYIIDNDEVSIKDLYENLVTNNYKKKISYGKFKTALKNIYSNVVTHEDTIGNLENKDFIEIVYYSNKYDMYLIKLNSNLSENNRYIGIRLLNNQSEFSITYIE